MMTSLGAMLEAAQASAGADYPSRQMREKTRERWL
jgi:hypothetical protein